MQMKGKVNVNDDAGLEKEADVMGAKAGNHLATSQPNKGKNNFLVQLSKNNSRVPNRLLKSFSAFLPVAQLERDEQTQEILRNIKLKREELRSWFIMQKKLPKDQRDKDKWRKLRQEQYDIGKQIVELRQANPKLQAKDATIGEKLGSGAISDVHRVSYDTQKGEIKKAFKPSLDASLVAGKVSRVASAGITEGDLSLRRIAAYKLDKLMETNVVPKTEFAELPSKDQGPSIIGTAMDLIQDAKSPKAMKDDRYQNPITNKGVADLETLDYISGEVDRHPDNFMIGEDGKVIGHDSEFGFGVNVSRDDPGSMEGLTEEQQQDKEVPGIGSLWSKEQARKRGKSTPAGPNKIRIDQAKHQQMDTRMKVSPMSHNRTGVPKRISKGVFDNINEGLVSGTGERSGAFEEDMTAKLAGYLSFDELKSRRKAVKHAKLKLREDSIKKVENWDEETPGEGGYYY